MNTKSLFAAASTLALAVGAIAPAPVFAQADPGQATPPAPTIAPSSPAASEGGDSVTGDAEADVGSAPLAADAAADEVSEIVVTGSRIQAAGYTAPTPVIAVDENFLLREARPTIGDLIRDLPAVGSSASPNNTSGAGNIVAGITGLDTVNLRNLGVVRTLVLFDGQRVVQSNVTGQIDIGTIPTSIVQRIDVVTAGASAAWGSDAVAGVVNLILNKKFDGFRASAEYGDTYKFDRENYRVQAAFGTGFDDDRGHVVVAGNLFDAPENVFANQRSWNKYRQLVNNPAYTPTNDEPRLIHADNVNLSGATTGGLIVGPVCRVALVNGACPAGQANPLVRQQFTGSDGVLAPFNATMVSGQVAANAETLHAALNNLAIRYRTSSLFGLLTYEFAPWLKASGQLNYGTTFSKNNSVPFIRIGAQAPTIRIDNPYLPAAVRQQMTDLGLTSIQVGTTNINNITEDTLSYDNFVTNAVGVPVATTDRALKRGVFSLEGELGSDWSYNAYVQHGQVRVEQRTKSNAIIANYNRAVDAVRNNAGQIVCRVNADANPANDDPACAPLNILGTGVASPEAIRYVNVAPGQNFQIQRLNETVAAVSVQGKLGFGFPAGDVALATGAEYRKEEGRIRNDPGAQARIYSVGNFPSFSGEYDVKETFLEVDVPILEDSFVKSLNLNAAGRITDYSTSGRVETWKVGFVTDIDDAIRLRGTISRDIRAPNLNELFSTGLSTLNSAVSPGTGVQVSIFTFASGNPDLVPEVANTYSAGLVLRPSFLRRFNLSLDYYKIDVDGAIATVGANEVLARCNAGDTPFCSQLVFNGPIGPNGQPLLSQINTFPQNIASLTTSGLDAQADWSVPFLTGDLQFRLVGNYTFELKQDQLGTVVEAAGAVGPDNPVTGFPKARLTFGTTYSSGPLSLTAQSRFIGAAKLVNSWTAKDVDDNSVPAVAYVDLRGSYQVNDQFQLFATVDNLLNKTPPNVAAGPAQGQSSYYFTATSGIIYDVLGRQYRVGARVRF